MSYRDATGSHFSLGPRGNGPRTRSHYPVGDRSTRSVDHRNTNPPNYSSVNVVTPAQAYATAVREGSPAHGLHYTIERRHSEQEGRVKSQFISSHLTGGLPGPGPSLAQRLYASALNNTSSSAPAASNLPILLPINHASSALPTKEGIHSSCGIPYRKTSISPSLLSTSSEEHSQPFNPSDLYYSSVVKLGLPSRSVTTAEGCAMRPPSLLPGLQVSNPSHLPHGTKLRSPYSPLQDPAPCPKVPITHPVLQLSHDLPAASQSNDVLAVGAPEASGPLAMSFSTHQPEEIHVMGGTSLSPAPSEPQMVFGSSSPPPFEEYDQLPPEVGVDTTSAVSHEPPLEDDSEEVPLYTLVDEELPPPPFDDIQAGTIVTEGPVEQSETLSQTMEALATPSQSPPQSPPPFSRSPSENATENAPTYSHSEEPSFSSSRSRNTNEDSRTPLFSTDICHSSDRSSSDPLNVVSSTSPPTSPPFAISHDEIVAPLTPPLPSDSRPLSVPSYRFSDGQSVGTYDSSAIHGSSPPLVNYRTKPTARQSEQPFLPPPALRSGPRPLEASNRRSRSLGSAIGDNTAIDALTRSMSDMVEGSSSARHDFAYENVSSGGQNVHRTSFGNDQNIPNSPASHPSGTTRIIENYETTRTEDERLAREAYLRPTHAETGGRTGHTNGTQGSGPVNPGVLSSQHLPPTVPGLIPPMYSHDKFYTETVRTAGVLHQFGETLAPSSGTSHQSDRSYIASTHPSPSFPYPLQPSHHPISRNARGPAAHTEPIPPQQQRMQSVQSLDPAKHGHSIPPPPPPPPPLLPPPPPPPPIGLLSWNAFKSPPTCPYSQDSTEDQFNQERVLTSNDLARKFAHDALRSLG